jgi:hypothetical protein
VVRADLVSDDENDEAHEGRSSRSEDGLVHALVRRVNADIRRDSSACRSRATVLRSMRCWVNPSHQVARSGAHNQARQHKDSESRPSAATDFPRRRLVVDARSVGPERCAAP